MSEISDPVKKWKATQAKLEAAQMEDAAPAADSDSDEDLDEVCLLLVKNITDFDRRWHISTTPLKTEEEKSKFGLKDKKFSLLLKVEFSRHNHPLLVMNLIFFSLSSNFGFSLRSNSG